jgi:hypothetical protein
MGTLFLALNMALAHREWSARKRRSESLAADLEEQEYDVGGKHFEIDRHKQICDESFQDFSLVDFAILEISIFANLNLCVLRRSAPPGAAAELPSKKSRCDLCETLTRKASQACTYVLFTSRDSCCRCSRRQNFVTSLDISRAPNNGTQHRKDRKIPVPPRVWCKIRPASY